jgi:two-component system chemotaxis sensor kinase CheA
MWKRLTRLVRLPSEITPFERYYLERTNRVAGWFVAAHVPIYMLVAWLHDTGPAFAFVTTTLVAVGSRVLARMLTSPRHVSILYGHTAMILASLLVHLGQGPAQIELHAYFFVLLALLAVFANPVVILVGGASFAIHHLVASQLLGGYDPAFRTVAVHGLFAAVETIAACFVARSFFDVIMGLERLAASRTAEVDARNRELRLVFDTVGQGFLTIDRAGRMSAERSAVLARWLGPPPLDETLASWLGRIDAERGALFALCWEAVVEGVLPLELTLAQMPRTFVAAGRHLRLDYTPILDGETLERVLVVLTDGTSELERERAEADTRDLVEIMDRVRTDRAGLLEFLSEGEALLATLRGGREDRVTTLRLLHTLKGNASLFGMSRVAAACHALEDTVTESGAAPSRRELDELAGLWTAMRARLAGVLGAEMDGHVELDEAEYDEILHGTTAGWPAPVLAEIVRGWKREPLRRRLARVGDRARAIADRLGKGTIRVDVEEEGVRLDPAGWSTFWSAFVHVVRNAVDHGIEPAAERRAAGKEPAGRIRLSGAIEGDALVVSIADDGRGIDWSEVARRASALGLPTKTQADLVDALLRDGFTTRDEVGAVSGRGVGMGAVAAACHERGGHMTVRSVPMHGTTITFTFPGFVEARRAA